VKKEKKRLVGEQPNEAAEKWSAEVEDCDGLGQTFYWCVPAGTVSSTESIYIAPGGGGPGVALFGFLISTVAFAPRQMAARRLRIPRKMKGLGRAPFELRSGGNHDGSDDRAAFLLPRFAAERVEKIAAILFWKSLPVVRRGLQWLAKATIPFAILPLLSFGVCRSWRGS